MNKSSERYFIKIITLKVLELVQLVVRNFDWFKTEKRILIKRCMRVWLPLGFEVWEAKRHTLNICPPIRKPRDNVPGLLFFIFIN
ncbi:MAG: hypothetical protein ACI8YQ_002409 [Polaribacter sp.]|jgi:hypothetical protein